MLTPWIEDDLVVVINDRLLVENGGGEGVRVNVGQRK
jgi:hypothetical protein